MRTSESSLCIKYLCTYTFSHNPFGNCQVLNIFYCPFFPVIHLLVNYLAEGSAGPSMEEFTFTVQLPWGHEMASVSFRLNAFWFSVVPLLLFNLSFNYAPRSSHAQTK